MEPTRQSLTLGSLFDGIGGFILRQLVFYHSQISP